MGGGMYFLIRGVFFRQLLNRYGVTEMPGSSAMAAFGILWAISVGFLLAVFHFARKD